MPVFNAARYLGAAVDSMLSQTFADFEFVIIDDGSTDGSYGILEEYAAKDLRIRLFRNETNRGIVFSLNRGLQECRGDYIARMDADDICLPDRLEKQLRIMEAYPGVVALGSALRYIDAKGRDLDVVRTTDLNQSFLAANPLFHPTVVMRRETLLRHGFMYREAYRYAEDYFLWLQLSKVGELKSSEEVLLQYRICSSASRVQNLKKMLWATLRVKVAGVAHLGIRPTVKDVGRFFIETILLLLPSSLVLVLYEKMTFRNKVQLNP
jgi:glycosyltransferase involved in cell wall biosynthesis